MNKFNITKGEAKKIIREEVEKVLKELENPNDNELRQMIQDALANLEEHASLIQQITFQLASNGVDNRGAVELVKAHSLYLKMLENALESLR
jgi:bacterioferritin (cytochrome b1)